MGYIHFPFIKVNRANGVGMFGGYHVIDFDEIYLPSLQQSKVFVMEESGKKKREIITEKTDDGIPLLPFGAITFAYRPTANHKQKSLVPIDSEKLGIHAHLYQ